MNTIKTDQRNTVVVKKTLPFPPPSVPFVQRATGVRFPSVRASSKPSPVLSSLQNCHFISWIDKHIHRACALCV